MASTLIGRTDCPECSFAAAHVKRAEGQDKRLYRYCPGCGAQYFTRSDEQEQRLQERTRTSTAPAAPGAPAATPKPAPLPDLPPAPPAPPAPKRSALFGI